MHNRVEIDLDALRSNYRLLRGWRGGDGECFAVIKQDAYGHGLLPCARALIAEQADGLAVSEMGEAARLRDAGFEAPIMVMSPILEAGGYRDCARLGLEPVVGAGEALAGFAGEELPRLWLKINSGMNRYGLHPDDLGAAIARIGSSCPIGLMTHLAAADDPVDSSADEQLELFRSVAAGYDFPASIVNSAGLLRWPDGLGDRARCGIALYGHNPLATTEPALRPVMTVRSRVLSIQHRLVGARIGYMGRDAVDEGTSTAVIAIGYSQGYPFPGARGAPLLINGERFPVVGRTSMNMIVADISAAIRPIGAGDDVVLWGQGLPVELVAKPNNTIPYQLMCASGNLPRTYRGDPENRFTAP